MCVLLWQVFFTIHLLVVYTTQKGESHMDTTEQKLNMLYKIDEQLANPTPENTPQPQTLAQIIDEFVLDHLSQHPEDSHAEAKRKATLVVMELVKNSNLRGLVQLLTDSPVPVAQNRTQRRRMAALEKKITGKRK